jgi:hypothetical protein
MALDDLLKMARMKKLMNLFKETKSWPENIADQEIIRQAYAQEAKRLNDLLRKKVENNLPITPDEAELAKKFQYEFYNVPSKNTYGTKNEGYQYADNLHKLLQQGYEKPIKQQQKEAGELFLSIRDDLKRIEDKEKRYLTPEELETYKAKVKQYFEMPGSDQDKYARISHEADFNERFRRLNRETYEKPLAKIIPLKPQSAALAIPAFENPLSTLADMASTYREKQGKAADYLTEMVNPTKLPVSPETKELGRIIADPLNLVSGALGALGSVLMLAPERKK